MKLSQKYPASPYTAVWFQWVWIRCPLSWSLAVLLICRATLCRQSFIGPCCAPPASPGIRQELVAGVSFRPMLAPVYFVIYIDFGMTALDLKPFWLRWAELCVVSVMGTWWVVVHTQTVSAARCRKYLLLFFFPLLLLYPIKRTRGHSLHPRLFCSVSITTNNSCWKELRNFSPLL